jgi:hypothetical protein
MRHCQSEVFDGLVTGSKMYLAHAASRLKTIIRESAWGTHLIFVEASKHIGRSADIRVRRGVCARPSGQECPRSDRGKMHPAWVGAQVRPAFRAFRHVWLAFWRVCRLMSPGMRIETAPPPGYD